MKTLSVAVIGCAMLMMAGCAGGPGVTMDPFTPEEVNVLVHAATATYLMERNVNQQVAASAASYIQAVRSSVASGTINLSDLRTEVVDKVPPQWQPLAAASWILIVKRVHIDQLIADGQYETARAYLDAALAGAFTALQQRAG